MPPDSSSFQFLNMPSGTAVPHWMGNYTMRARAGTDLWRKPEADTSTAPILYTSPSSTFFRAEVLIAANWQHECDQGGLVIFAGNKWVKAGIEMYDGLCNASSVVASADGCDWQISELPRGVSELRVRFEKFGEGLWIWFDDGTEWKKIREVTWFFYNVDDKMIRVGTYVSRPATYLSRQTEELVVEFEGLEIF